MSSIIEGAKYGAFGGLLGAIIGISLVEGLNGWADFPPNPPDSIGYSSFYTWLEPHGLEILATREHWYKTFTAGSFALGALVGALFRVGR